MSRPSREQDEDEINGHASYYPIGRSRSPSPSRSMGIMRFPPTRAPDSTTLPVDYLEAARRLPSPPTPPTAAPAEVEDAPAPSADPRRGKARRAGGSPIHTGDSTFGEEDSRSESSEPLGGRRRPSMERPHAALTRTYAALLQDTVTDRIDSFLERHFALCCAILLLFCGALAWYCSSASTTTSIPTATTLPALLAASVRLFFVCFSLIGALNSLAPDSPIGVEWRNGLDTLPDLFLAIGGMLAGVPLLRRFFESAMVKTVFEGWFGSNAAVAANMLVAIDMGGNSLAGHLLLGGGDHHEGAVVTTGGRGAADHYVSACVLGYSSGVTFSFSIPIGLAMLRSEAHRRLLVLGLIPGLCCVPVSCLISYTVLALQTPFAIAGPAAPHKGGLVHGLDVAEAFRAVAVPLWIVAVLAYLLARFRQPWLLVVFKIFGAALEVFIRGCFFLSLLQDLGGCRILFEDYCPVLVMDPLLPAQRAGGGPSGLQVAGSIALLLTGVYPFVHLLKIFLLHKTLIPFGSFLGFSDPSGRGVLGALASTTNTICLFQSIRSGMQAKEAVLGCAFMVCGGFVLGDYLVYASIYQPQLLGALVVGKLTGGLLAVELARRTTARMVVGGGVPAGEDKDDFYTQGAGAWRTERGRPGGGAAGSSLAEVLLEKARRGSTSEED